MNKRLFRNTLALCLFVATSYAQVPPSVQRSVDSVKRLLPGATGATRYELTFKIGYDLFDVDNSQAVKYAEEAFGLSKELGDSATIVRSGRIYGQLLWRVGELTKAIEIMEWVRAIAERCSYEKDLRFLSNSLAISYTYRGQYDKALEHNLRSLELRQEKGDKLEIAIAHSNIGTTFYAIGIYDRAAEFLKKSLAIDSLNHYTPDLKISLALCYNRLNYLKDSRSLIQSVLDEYRGKISTHTLTRISLGLGIVDMREGNFPSAKAHLKSGYLLAARDSNKTFMSDCLIAIGQVHLATGELEAAEKALIQAEFFSSKIGYRNGTEAANMSLGNLYSLKKDYVKASTAKSKVLAFRDSSISQQVMENIHRHQFDFYQKENRKTIATQAELLTLQELVIDNTRTLIVFSWMSATLLVSVVVLLYRSYRQKKQVAIDLELRVHERTSELKTSMESLQRSHIERNFMLDGIARRLNANVATFKGLGEVATTYDGVPMEFVRNIDKASDNLAIVLQLIARSKK